METIELEQLVNNAINGNQDAIDTLTKQGVDVSQIQLTQSINEVAQHDPALAVKLYKQQAEAVKTQEVETDENKDIEGYKSLDEIATIHDASERLNLIRQYHLDPDVSQRGEQVKSSTMSMDDIQKIHDPIERLKLIREHHTGGVK